MLHYPILSTSWNGEQLIRDRRIMGSNPFSGSKTKVVAFGMTVNGREGFHLVHMSFATAFPHSQIHQKNAVVNSDQVVIEYDFVDTHTKLLATPIRPVPPTGKSVNIPGIELYGLQNGEIASIRTYFDAATTMWQLGLPS